MDRRPLNAPPDHHRTACAAPGSNVTLGSAGVQIHSSGGSIHLSATQVDDVVDTTGAGDAFVGTLAALLASGHDLASAARAAGEAAAQSVGWAGARPPRTDRMGERNAEDARPRTDS
ncbi:MAG TPA: PfkB family carbohydrate kinase [Propionicimonas sp.]|nr:PfkB family carbohydrate kinase [Propionicimonas sp.]HRA05076.1 PfkB family carbohydrate kinase [Propionicimonas sp.]